MRYLQQKIARVRLVQSAFEIFGSAHSKDAPEILLPALSVSVGRFHETGGIHND